MTRASELAIFAVAASLLALASYGCGRRGEPPETDAASTVLTDAADETDAGTFYIDFNAGGASDTDDVPPSVGGVDDETLDKIRLEPTLDMGSDYLDRFLFVCDRTVFGLKALGMLDEGRGTDQVVSGEGASLFVMTPSPTVYTTENGSEPLVDLIARRKPEYVLLAVGADDISRKPKPAYADFREAYLNLITSVAEASPSTTVICMSILPGSPSSGVSVYNAEQYNALIIEAAASSGSDRVYYLDAASAFAAQSGYLRADCDGGSSQLSTTGFKRLLDIIKTHYVAGAST